MCRSNLSLSLSRVLQCVNLCCSVLQCVAVGVGVCESEQVTWHVGYRMLHTACCIPHTAGFARAFAGSISYTI